MIIETDIVRSRTTQGPDWRRELQNHNAKPRLKPDTATSALVARAEQWLLIWMEMATSGDGRSAKDAKLLHGRLMEAIVQLARLNLRIGEPSIDGLSLDLAGAVRGAIAKLEEHGGDDNDE